MCCFPFLSPISWEIKVMTTPKTELGVKIGEVPNLGPARRLGRSRTIELWPPMVVLVTLATDTPNRLDAQWNEDGFDLGETVKAALGQ